MRFSTGLAAMTLVKLTTSLAAFSPASPASTASRGPRPSRVAARPSSAPSALAPASPSIARSPRSSGSSAAAAPSGAATTAEPDRVSASGAPVISPTLIARPGRRSNRFIRFAAPAMLAPLTRVSNARPVRVRAGDPAIAAAASPVAPMPRIFTAPLVTSPRASAPRWPLKPRDAPDPARSSYPPRAPDPAPASSAAARIRPVVPGASSPAAAAPATTAGPSSSVTGSPRWLTRPQTSSPGSPFSPGGRRVSAA
ncbi:Uncharacterised protein [Mycobacterium tuberculosis]|nr:Uncharacterised protein [Mycobacterium tuberculosis]